MDNDKKNLKKQIIDLYGKVVYTNKAHLKDMDILTNKLLRVKWYRIIFSSISSVGVIGSIFNDALWIKSLSTIVSVVLVIISLYFKDFSVDKKIIKHKEVADKLWIIIEEYISLLTDFNSLEYDEIILKRDNLIKRTNEIYSNSIQTTPKGYNKAVKSLKNGEQVFSNEELNNILPEYLRNNK